MKTESLRVKIFADGADLNGMLSMYQNPLIKGFTTNPTLMRKAGISNYEQFARDVVEQIPDRPVSFEVFADDFNEMERQAKQISTWGKNIYVKIPVTDTHGVFSGPLIKRLSDAGIQLNITALTTLDQVADVMQVLRDAPPNYVSVFAGRVADTGVDPVPLMQKAVDLLRVNPRSELIWASPRELLNIIQADQIGCQVITVTNDILKKLPLLGKDLTAYSLETVKMFFNDAASAGFSI